MSPSKQHQ
jgi:hypothetical protein